MTGAFVDFGMASAYCLPIVVKYEQNSLAIRVLSVDFTPFTINVSEMVLLLLTRPVIVF